MPSRNSLSAEERRSYLLDFLKNNKGPVKAAELAQTTGVSRQVIVQDMALLRAKDEPVMATPQGYLYLNQNETGGRREKIYVKHSLEDTEKELTLMVDYGATIIDVGVEHSVYGRIYRSLDIKSRRDVKRFMEHLSDTNANLLSSLTNGFHFHTLEVPSQDIIEQICSELAVQGFLVKRDDVNAN